MKLFRMISFIAVIVSILNIDGFNQADANVAQDITANYNKIVNNCGSNDKPASGNLIRFTSWSLNYYVGNPSKQSYTLKGIPFKYIRRDIPIDKSFGYKLYGLNYYPSMITLQSKIGNTARCFFLLMDGLTVKC